MSERALTPPQRYVMRLRLRTSWICCRKAGGIKNFRPVLPADPFEIGLPMPISALPALSGLVEPAEPVAPFKT